MSSSARDGAATTFGDLLRRHRIAGGCSQEQLAERAGLSAYVDTVDVLAKR